MPIIEDIKQNKTDVAEVKQSNIDIKKSLSDIMEFLKFELGYKDGE